MSGSPTTTDDPYAAYASLILTSPTNPLADDQINNLHISYPLLWRRIIGLSVFCFFILATTILFVWYRKERAIRAHSVSLTIAQTVTILIGTPLTNMQMGIYGAYPCFFLFIGLYYGLVMWGLVVVGRALRLQIIFRFHKEAAANYLADVEGFNPANATGGDSIAEGVSGEGRSTPHRRRSRSRSSSSSQSMDSASRNLILGLGVQRRATRSAWIVIISAFCIITVYFLVIFFATNSIEIADDLFAFQHPLTVIGVEGKTKRGVQCSKTDPTWWPAFAFMAAHIVITTPTALYFHWRTNDAYGIRQDLFVTNLFTVPSFFLYFAVSSWWWRFNPYFGPNDVLYFIFGVSHVMSVCVPLCRLWLERYRRQRLKMNFSSFSQVLRDPELFKQLKDYAVRDLCSEQTIFIEEVNKVKDSVARSSFESEGSTTLVNKGEIGFSAQALANSQVPFELEYHYVAIMELFIRHGGTMELNLSGPVRQSCIDAIESGRITIDVFDAAYDEVANSLYLNTYPKLLNDLAGRKKKSLTSVNDP